ncbi:MAG: 30S ribosomal protein S17 [Planctomycetota bacterium]|jgi:small subunit ribosomal protein S17
MSTEENTNRRIVRRTGVVRSAAMDKTIVVRVDRKVRHPIYGKYVKRHTTLKAHDERNEAGVGDRVDVVFCRPLSKSKRWKLERIATKAPSSALEGGA